MSWEGVLKILEFIWKILEFISVIAAVVGAVYSFWIKMYLRRKEKHDNALIDLKLRCDEANVTIILQGQIRRKNLTRAEVQGLLGILPMLEKGKRYELQDLNRKSFFDQLEDVQVNYSATQLVVKCTLDELKQFDLAKVKELCEVEGNLPAIACINIA